MDGPETKGPLALKAPSRSSGTRGLRMELTGRPPESGKKGCAMSPGEASRSLRRQRFLCLEAGSATRFLPTRFLPEEGKAALPQKGSHAAEGLWHWGGEGRGGVGERHGGPKERNQQPCTTWL